MTMVRDPVSVFTRLNFSADQHTRLMLLAINVAQDETASVVTVQAEDLQHRIYSLPVEFIGPVPNYALITEIVVRLPDELTNLTVVQVNIIVRSVPSNKVLINIKQ